MQFRWARSVFAQQASSGHPSPTVAAAPVAAERHTLGSPFSSEPEATGISLPSGTTPTTWAVWMLPPMANISTVAISAGSTAGDTSKTRFELSWDGLMA